MSLLDPRRSNSIVLIALRRVKQNVRSEFREMKEKTGKIISAIKQSSGRSQSSFLYGLRRLAEDDIPRQLQRREAAPIAR